MFVERCPKQRRHLAGSYGCLLQRRDAPGELLASGGVEGMDIAGPRVREMRLPDAAKVRRVAVERKGAPDPGRRCRQSFADIGVQRRVSATVRNRISKTLLRLQNAIAAISLGRVKTTWK